MSIKLFAGERFLLEDDTCLAIVLSGRIEMYATTQKSEEISFHQCYLGEKGPQEAVFPAMDEFWEISMQICALEDAELELAPWDEVDMERLRRLMQGWFAGLVQLSWVKLLADKGDDILQLWRSPRMQ